MTMRLARPLLARPLPVPERDLECGGLVKWPKSEWMWEWSEVGGSGVGLHR